MQSRVLQFTVAAIALISGLARADAPPPDWKLEGWIDGDYSASSTRRSNLPLGFNLFADHAHLHQAWLTIDHPLIKPSADGPGRAQLHFDLYVGSDYVFTRARGLFGRQTGEIGFDPLQFFVQGHVDGLARGTDVQVGRFSSPIGAEYNASANNALPSHSYSFIYDPFTHTGVYASTTLDDYWTVLNGVVTGCDVFVDPADRITFIDGARYVDKKDSRRSAQLIAITDHNAFDVAHTFNNIDVVDLVVTYPIGKRLLLTHDTVYGWEHGVPGLGDVHWFGLVPYFTWTFSDALSSTLRLERFDDAQGNRTGFAGVYDSVTLGLSWKPEKWLLVRPELRHDRNDASAPFEGKDHISTATIDVVAKF